MYVLVRYAYRLYCDPIPYTQRHTNTFAETNTNTRTQFCSRQTQKEQKTTTKTTGRQKRFKKEKRRKDKTHTYTYTHIEKCSHTRKSFKSNWLKKKNAEMRFSLLSPHPLFFSDCPIFFCFLDQSSVIACWWYGNSENGYYAKLFEKFKCW